MGGNKRSNSARWQMIFGFLAALLSIWVVSGSILLALKEDETSRLLSQAATDAFSTTPAAVLTSLPTQTPGGPTETESISTPSASVTTEMEAAACQPPAGWVATSVQPGDTLETLAQQYEIDLQVLKDANCLVSNRLITGILLYVPGKPTETVTETPVPSKTSVPCGPPSNWLAYQVQAGDTLYSLAVKTNSTVRELQFANCLSSPNRIRVGQVIYLPRLPATVTPTATPTSTATKVEITPDPNFTLDKVTSSSGVSAAGEEIHYTLRLRNTGNVTLTGATISDPLLGSLDCSPAQVASLAPGAELTCSGTYTVTQEDLDSNGGGDGEIANTATGDTDQTAVKTASTGVSVNQNPEFTFAKTTTSEGVDAVDDVIEYTLSLTNTGNVTLTGATISDPLLGTLTCNQPASLAPGAALTCTGIYTISQSDISSNGNGDGDIDNTAMGYTDNAGTQTSSVAVPILQPGLLALPAGDTSNFY